MVDSGVAQKGGDLVDQDRAPLSPHVSRGLPVRQLAALGQHSGSQVAGEPVQAVRQPLQKHPAPFRGNFRWHVLPGNSWKKDISKSHFFATFFWGELYKSIAALPKQSGTHI